MIHMLLTKAIPQYHNDWSALPELHLHIIIWWHHQLLANSQFEMLSATKSTTRDCRITYQCDIDKPLNNSNNSDRTRKGGKWKWQLKHPQQESTFNFTPIRNHDVHGGLVKIISMAHLFAITFIYFPSHKSEVIIYSLCQEKYPTEWM